AMPLPSPTMRSIVTTIGSAGGGGAGRRPLWVGGRPGRRVCPDWPAGRRGRPVPEVLRGMRSILRGGLSRLSSVSVPGAGISFGAPGRDGRYPCRRTGLVMTQGRAIDEDRTDEGRRWRLAVLLSGSGRTLENLLGVIERGELHAEIVTVISSRSGVRGIEIARQAGIPATVIPRKGYPDARSHSRAICTAIEPFEVDLVLLAGYLRQLVIEPAWVGRMLNIHPALLPQAEAYAAGRGLYGERVHAAVLAHGDTVSGAT